MWGSDPKAHLSSWAYEHLLRVASSADPPPTLPPDSSATFIGPRSMTLIPGSSNNREHSRSTSCTVGRSSRLTSQAQLGERYGKRILNATSGGFSASAKYQTTSAAVESKSARPSSPLSDGDRGTTWDMSNVCGDLCRRPEIRGARGDF
jgi:hypothetical protein